MSAELMSRLSEQLHKILKPEDADKIMAFLDQNQQTICWTIGGLAMFFLGKKLIPKPEAPKKKKHRKRKKKKLQQTELKEAAVALDPAKLAALQIQSITEEFEKEYLPGLQELFKSVDKQTEHPKKNKQAPSYKDEFNYRYLYYNESLTKLLMRLDGVETFGNEEVRASRKQAIKTIQGYCTELDKYKPKIDALKEKGITA